MKASKYRKKHGLPPGPIKGTDGKVYDAKKNTVDGMPPLEVGDVFYFRGIGSPHATVTKAKMTRHFGKIAVFVLLSPENNEDIGVQFFDLRRVEVVQMAAPVAASNEKTPPLQSDEEIDILDEELAREADKEAAGSVGGMAPIPGDPRESNGEPVPVQRRQIEHPQPPAPPTEQPGGFTEIVQNVGFEFVGEPKEPTEQPAHGDRNDEEERIEREDKSAQGVSPQEFRDEHPETRINAAGDIS